jgi:hypothetical protein
MSQTPLTPEKAMSKYKIASGIVPYVSVRRQSNARAAMKGREKLRGLGTGFLKSPDMAGVGMPQC